MFLFTLGMSFLSLAKEFNKKLWFFFLSCIIFCIVALRYKSAPDYFSYWNLYDKVVNTAYLGLFTYKIYPAGGGIESGFALLAFIEKKIYGHYFVFVAIFSFISLYVKYRAIKQLSPFIILSALLYASLYIFGDIGEIRQRMASGIVLYSVIFAYKRQPLKFLITIFIAITMHNSALIGMAIYFIPYISRPVILWALLLLSVSIAVNGGIGIPLLTSIGKIIGVDESSRLISYTTSRYLDGYKLFGGTFSLQLLLSVLMLCFYKQLVTKWSYNKILIPMYVYGSVFMFSFIDYGIIGGRIATLFCSYSSLIIIPSFLFLFKRKDRLVPFFIMVGYCCIWFTAIMRKQSPYESILQFLL
jgi:transmembrane protein EpsG